MLLRDALRIVCYQKKNLLTNAACCQDIKSFLIVEMSEVTQILEKKIFLDNLQKAEGNSYITKIIQKKLYNTRLLRFLKTNPNGFVL